MQFLHQVSVQDGGHMVWRGEGLLYGRKAERVVFEVYQRKCGENEEVYSECGVEGCINPRHLGLREKVGGDSLPQANAKKTHCVRGHPFDEGNTYRRKDGTRCCRACVRERMRRHYLGLNRRVKEGLEVAID